MNLLPVLPLVWAKGEVKSGIVLYEVNLHIGAGVRQVDEWSLESD